MLKVEKLVCTNPEFHKDCNWVNARITYPDANYLMLKDRLIREVKKTHIAYRIIHHKFQLLTTIKFGHDGVIYVGDNEDALRKLALSPQEIVTWLR